MARRLAGGAVALAAIGLAGCASDAERSGTESTTTTVIITTTECSDSIDTTQVPVLVIREDITAGTTAEDAIANGSLVEEEAALGLRPATAVDSLDDMAGGVAISDLPQDQVVVVHQWGLPPDRAVGAQAQPICPR